MTTRIKEAYEARANEAEFILYHMNEGEPKIKLLQETFKVTQIIGKGVDDDLSERSPKRYPKSGVYLDVEFAEPFDADSDPAAARMLSSLINVPVVYTASEHDGCGGDWSFFRVIILNPLESLLPQKKQVAASAVQTARAEVASRPIPVGKLNADGLMEYRVGGKTYVDVAKVPFFKSMACSFSSGYKGADIVTDYMKTTGKWAAILKANNMYEDNGQVYKHPYESNE